MSADITDEMVTRFEEEYLAALYPDRRDFALSPPGNNHFEAYRRGLAAALRACAVEPEEVREMVASLRQFAEAERQRMKHHNTWESELADKAADMLERLAAAGGPR